ncbi:DUF323-domain-containing protein [Conidiobolus coronatus NRRL 28638]|uniref:DUF323-domain-containing protein n=1 Tax=Conidiobolus coronatus (strain ATCC 28846 / CBS 209.66 / NRRL 28638) TaxID=796925 RepID=A0A137P1D9_CONC2|nr:DUF323-domain-containing protein [Conidiobolus coronatus NRRL 28638]|eukprot:KXN68694.1 DUF323-domain-containing protein [Conidiobolus coronatus NRRL 28638]
MSTCEFCPGPNYIANNKDSKIVIASFYKPEFYFLPKHLAPNKPTPGLNSWNQLFKAWDYVTGQMITPNMRLEQPISLRHPFIFYFGHIPAFLDIQISRHFQQPYTEPSYYVNIFERGIDPDVDDPTKCHDHSEVPKDWPKYEDIMDYDARVRERLNNILKNESLTARLGRVLFISFEHQAMHLETLMYMLIQSNSFTAVPKQLTMFNNFEQRPLSPSPWIQVEGGSLSLGHDDDENEDHQNGYFDIREYGWDNETPSRQAVVKPFMIQSRPVTNIEFFEFIKCNPGKPIPALWTPEPANRFGYKVRTFHGALPFEQCINWPVQVCYRDILSYFEWKGDGSRLPTEEELAFCDQNYYKLNKQLNPNSQYLPSTHRENVGLKHWTPTAVTNDSFNLMETLWEWTGSFLGPYPGYHPSELYPGYSYDFHDEKHLVVLGGSYLSNPWFAKRITFRNWFHEGYPYAFIGFRAVKDI